MEVVFCEAIEDGGNLFSVFRKTSERNSPEVELRINPEGKINLLKKQKRDYFLNFQTYTKFFPKLLRLINEKYKSNRKNAKEILDSIY